jgi:hypothetical protein
VHGSVCPAFIKLKDAILLGRFDFIGCRLASHRFNTLRLAREMRLIARFADATAVFVEGVVSAGVLYKCCAP